MISIYPYENLGGANHGWLNAKHHFSFARYHNPNRMGFGTLRVINDDIVQAGTGFDTHPHRDMEIITYVRSGAITHRDSQNNEGRTAAGDVQVMSAGTGVFHSEYNLEEENTNLYQIWIEPAQKAVAPRWEARQFPKTPVKDALVPLVSGRDADLERGALFIHQDAAIHGGQLRKDAEIRHRLTYMGYVLASQGEILLNGHPLKKGDGAEITDEHDVVITALTDAEVLVIDVPPASAGL
jgi:redox-sensitive bicupin YhaK (pirin superfamily)